jgi:hypothetical protein
MHSHVSPLPGKRDLARFGGEIWELQGTIENLDLKVNEAASGAGGGGGGGTDTEAERRELLEEENARLKRERLVALAQAPILQNYLGAYEQGGILPDTGFYLGHKGEEVIPAHEVGRDSGYIILEPHIHLSGAAAALDGFIDARLELRQRRSDRRVGLARGTPSAPGRKATFSQGRQRP